MVEHKFNNKYDIIPCAFSSLLDCFEKEDQLFAAQCNLVSKYNAVCGDINLLSKL